MLRKPFAKVRVIYGVQFFGMEEHSVGKQAFYNCDRQIHKDDKAIHFQIDIDLVAELQQYPLTKFFEEGADQKLVPLGKARQVLPEITHQRRKR